MTDKLTRFDYLLNAMHHAGQEENPAQAGYGDKRRALFEHVRALEKDAERYRWLRSGVSILDAARDGRQCEQPLCIVTTPAVSLPVYGDEMDAAIDAAMKALAAVGAA